ncbi:hypothetical protein QAD02_006540 [Eretmocerus hayati]|uniref:Uncharacterized protein n=1 Tax=Eretmocerus hayati TaxID=131215 RepID=A0ACC2N2A5_9HYME|nr:hypothetical protein QAD02_006540 [Eretmocerus hayati]
MINPAWLMFFILAGHDVLAQQILGCFKSSSEEPDLPLLVARRVNSPAECVKECKASYYMFAGLMKGYECRCGSQVGRKGPANDCNIYCSGDSNLPCGSDESMSIYASGHKGPSPPTRIHVTNREQDSLKVIWQKPYITNGKIVSYTLKAIALQTTASYPLPLVESEVLGESSNSTTLQSLHPGTQYNITMYASNNEGSSDIAYAIEWTRIGPPNQPNVPKILSKSDRTVTIEVPQGSSENGPLSYYHVVVVQAGTVAPTSSDVAYESFDKAMREGLGYYLAGKFDVSDYGMFKKFVVGDGRLIGGYHNVPLDGASKHSQIGIALESRIRDEVQYSYSDLTSSPHRIHTRDSSNANTANATTVILYSLIVLLSILLLATVLIYFILRKKFQQVQRHRLPEHQELTLQGPLHEVDNMAYIPEDIPERTNHYQDLKSKVWSIPRNFLNFDPNPMRRGHFGTVHMGTVQRDAIPVPVTVHKISDTQLKGSEKRKMLRELDVCIKAGSSKYLASLVGNCETPDTLFVAFEMPPQNLKQRLLSVRSGEHFPCEQMLRIGACIADALRHLDSLKIVHGCVCARSVGLLEDYSPKIMGHGLSKYVLEDVKYARWTAIETFANPKRPQAPSVVWAYGVLLWEMFAMGGTPYSNLEMDSDVEEAVNVGRRLEQLPDVPDPVYEVMNSCWLKDPEERPTFDELVRLVSFCLE